MFLINNYLEESKPIIKNRDISFEERQRIYEERQRIVESELKSYLAYLGNYDLNYYNEYMENNIGVD